MKHRIFIGSAAARTWCNLQRLVQKAAAESITSHNPGCGLRFDNAYFNVHYNSEVEVHWMAGKHEVCTAMWMADEHSVLSDVTAEFQWRQQTQHVIAFMYQWLIRDHGLDPNLLAKGATKEFGIALAPQSDIVRVNYFTPQQSLHGDMIMDALIDHRVALVDQVHTPASFSQLLSHAR